MFDIFKKEMPSGANLDTRSADERAKDYRFEEIVSAVNPVVWTEKPREAWRKFPIFDQDGSGSCVAQTMAKLLGILYWQKNGEYVHFSATHLYQRRINRPLAGMGGVNVFDIARQGVTLESLAPSQGLSDAKMDGYAIEKYKEDVGKVFAIGNYVVLPINDIDTIASVIETTGKGVMVWFYFTYPEWTNIPTVNGNVDILGAKTIRHSVTAVDKTLYKGEKALIIEDSWGEQYGFGGQRVITESFFKERNFFAAYPINFKFEAPEATQKPRHRFSLFMSFTTGNEKSDDVRALQDILKYEGFFPANVESTGLYGSITAKGVLAWQKKHLVAPFAELEGLQGKYCGHKTIAMLNTLYG